MREVSKLAEQFSRRHTLSDAESVEFHSLLETTLASSHLFDAQEVDCLLRRVSDPRDYSEMDHLLGEITTALLDTPVDSLFAGIDSAWPELRVHAAGFLTDLLGQCARVHESGLGACPSAKRVRARIDDDPEFREALVDFSDGSLFLQSTQNHA